MKKAVTAFAIATILMLFFILLGMLFFDRWYGSFSVFFGSLGLNADAVFLAFQTFLLYKEG